MNDCQRIFACLVICGKIGKCCYVSVPFLQNSLFTCIVYFVCRILNPSKTSRISSVRILNDSHSSQIHIQNSGRNQMHFNNKFWCSEREQLILIYKRDANALRLFFFLELKMLNLRCLFSFRIQRISIYPKHCARCLYMQNIKMPKSKKNLINQMLCVSVVKVSTVEHSTSHNHWNDGSLLFVQQQQVNKFIPSQFTFHHSPVMMMVDLGSSDVIIIQENDIHILQYLNNPAHFNING